MCVGMMFGEVFEFVEEVYFECCFVVVGGW